MDPANGEALTPAQEAFAEMIAGLLVNLIRTMAAEGKAREAHGQPFTPGQHEPEIG